MLKPLIFPSPNKKHNAVLTPLGDPQLSTEYYTLSIDGDLLLFANRIFGKVCLWSAESRFLSVQELKETDGGNPPKSYQLLLVDLVARRQCVVASVDASKCNILPEGFIGESLMYSVIYAGEYGATKNFESKFQYLDSWQSIS